MKDAGEIKLMLAAQAEAVAQMLLPSGKRVGREYCVGGVGGEPGSSLKICLEGARAGLWSDFATSQGGDLLDLWKSARNIDFVTALKQARDYLGLRDEPSEKAFRPPAKRNYVRPQLDTVEPLTSGGPVYDYLTKARGISPDILRRYRIQQVTSATHGPACVFPIYEPTGKVVDMAKYLATKRGLDGKKFIWATPDAKPHLFGWQAIDGNARDVVITEGEIDALTVADWGFAALSIPSGVKNMEWIEHDFDPLARFERIFVLTDNDAPGHECAEVIAKRLGRERCFRVILPGFKDANEALKSGKFVGPDFETAIDAGKTLDPAELVNAGDLGDLLWEELNPSNPETLGTETPWDIDWKIRPGEVTIWTGWNGHGKSHALMQVMLNDASQKQRCLVASFEMPVAQSLRQLASMCIGRRPRSRTEADAALAWLSPGFWFYNVVGVKPWREFMPVFEYAIRRYGISRIVIDSLLRVGVGEEDYEAQKEFVGHLVEFAAKYKVHVHLVCHARKQDDESKAPGKMDIRGSGSITDLVHNGFSVWRNKGKEQAIAKAKAAEQVPAAELVYKHDASLAMWKNRKTGVEPFRLLWLNPASLQFVDRSDGRSRVYLQSTP